MTLMALKAGSGGGGWPPSDQQIRQVFYNLRGRSEAFSQRLLLCFFEAIFTCVEEELPSVLRSDDTTLPDFAKGWREHLNKDQRQARNRLYEKAANKVVCSVGLA